jgi:transcriptional regulator GlxA family with amidase domain
MTSQGVGTAIDFALNIVRELQGESSFKDLKESILA